MGVLTRGVFCAKRRRRARERLFVRPAGDLGNHRVPVAVVLREAESVERGPELPLRRHGRGTLLHWLLLLVLLLRLEQHLILTVGCRRALRRRVREREVHLILWNVSRMMSTVGRALRDKEGWGLPRTAAPWAAPVGQCHRRGRPCFFFVLEGQVGRMPREQTAH